MHATDSTTVGTDVSDGSGVVMSNDSYGAWMMVTRRKSGQRRIRNATGLEGPPDLGLCSGRQQEEERLGTNLSSVGWNREANRVEPKGDIGSGPEGIKGVEANGPFVVGREPFAGHKRGGILNEARLSSSVKGKKELARNRAPKWVSKSEVGEESRKDTHINSGWVAPGQNGDGQGSGELFQFAASSRGELGLQAQADEGSGCLKAGFGRLGDGASRKEDQSRDGDQCKAGGCTASTSEGRSKVSGDGSLIDGRLCDQNHIREQQPGRRDGVDSGYVEAADESVARDGKCMGEDGMDGLEFGKGSGVCDRSV
nr:hypothetical protein CFP56_51411 [Quercus suber]